MSPVLVPTQGLQQCRRGFLCGGEPEYTKNRNSPKGHSGSGGRLPGGGDTRVLPEEQESSQLSGVGIGSRQESDIWRTLPAPSALPALPWVTDTLQSRGLGLLQKHFQPKPMGTRSLPGGVGK